jgi:hypothetical protein
LLPSPLTRIALQSDLSPKGEVTGGTVLPLHHLSLGGEVGAERRVRGPSL